MRRSAPRRIRHRLPAFVLLTAVAPCFAFPEGAPWHAAGAHGCGECHFGSAPVIASQALSLAGVPARITAGQRVELVLRLEDADMRAAGFLLSASAGGEPAGRFEPLDARTEANGALVRHTRDGTVLAADGEASWRVRWIAPHTLRGAVRFDAWANASDDDRSPLGDRIHRRTWEIAPAR